MLKKQLQNLGEDLAFQSKNYFKSYSLSIFFQITLLTLPFSLVIISLYLGGVWWLEMLSLLVSIFSFGYYLYFGINTNLYMIYGDKVLLLYKKVHSYYLSTTEYTVDEINSFLNVREELIQDKNKPNVHFFAKYFVAKNIEKEMLYGNEEIVWWKQ